MGLDIYIETQPKNDLNNEASRKQVAYFRKFNALVGWMERNVGQETPEGESRDGQKAKRLFCHKIRKAV